MSGWTKAVTPHFILYLEGGSETNDQTSAHAALLRLESARSFFLQTPFAGAVPQLPIRVVAFQGEATYSAYRANPAAFAFYRQIRSRDYIVVQQLSGGPERAAVHEYVHSVFYHLAPKLPLWLAEGLAEVYSSTQVTEGVEAVGTQIPEHLRTLSGGKPLNLPMVFRAKQDSTSYVMPQQLWNFYATSWAATHMLLLSPEYADRFLAFFSEVSTGVPVEEAFEGVYGKSVAMIEDDLRTYLAQNHLPVASNRFEVASFPAQTMMPLGSSELNSILADLVLPGSPQQAQISRQLEQLTHTDARSPKPEEALGYLSLREGQLVSARAHFQSALEKGTRDVDVLLRLAELDQKAGMPFEDFMPLVKQALALDSSNDGTRFRLGWIAAKAGSYQLAVSLLSEVRTISSDQRFALLYTLAYCCLKSEDGERGRAFGLNAKAEAHTPEQQQQVAMLLQYADRAPLH